MEAKTNYTIVGLAVVILSTALLATFLWLSVGFDKKKYNIYAVYEREAVSGLNIDSPVKYNGVQVGSVYKISLSRVDPQQVVLLLNIEEGTPITNSTRATLISQGITGVTFIGLSASSPDLTPLKKLPEEPYPIIPSTPSLLNQIDKTIKEVAENVNSLGLKIKSVFDEENTQNVKKTLENLQKFTTVVAEHNEDIGQSLKNSDELFRNMAAASKDLRKNINKLTKEMTSAGQSVTLTMRAGQNALNKISGQAVPQTVQLLQKLNNIAANLEKVSTQLRQNPSVVIRGTVPPTPGPGEHK